MFIAMGLSAIFPVLHGLEMYGIRQMNRQIGLFWLVLQGFLYILGACIYVVRKPKGLLVNQCDIRRLTESPGTYTRAILPREIR